MSNTTIPLERNYDKFSEDLALEQIFTSTKYAAPASKVKFGIPSELDQFPNIQVDENTFVPVEIDEAFGDTFDGASGFIYRRLSMDVLEIKSDIKIIPLQYPYTVHEILPQINALLNTKLSEQDVVNEQYFDNDTPFVLTAGPASLAWIDSKQLTISDPLQKFLFNAPFINGFIEYDPSTFQIG